MSYCVTTALEGIQSLKKRISVIQGGTSAGKTIAILIILLNYLLEHSNKIVTVVTNTYRNLETGAMRDFLKICRDTNVDQLTEWNKADHRMTFPNGSLIEFYSIDNMGAHGSRRDVLFVNEGNRISWDTFSNLEIRTTEKIYVDFNPVNEFWAHTELVNSGRDDVDFIKFNYKDNEGLDDRIVEAIEKRKGDGTSNWWRVYGMGEVGSLEGNVYEGWAIADGIPKGFVLKRYGVDFGWNDPTAVIAVYENDEKEILFNEMLYKSKVPTPELVEFLKGLPPALMVCDSARPEIIADIRAAGVQAIGCDKSTKSPDGKINNVMWGINLVQGRKCYYTADSKNLEREYLTYAWRKKKTGEIQDVPIDEMNHALDAIRYCVLDLERKPIEYGGVIVGN